jgi:hypothetical protein
MTTWESLARFIKPAPPTPTSSSPAVPYKMTKQADPIASLIENGIGRLVYVGLLFLLFCIIYFLGYMIGDSLKESGADPSSYEDVQIFLYIISAAFGWCIVFLRLKNIGNSNTRSVVLAVVGLIPIISIPIALFCLFWPPNSYGKAKT